MVISVRLTEIGRAMRICELNWSIRYTLGYRHRLREFSIIQSARALPKSCASSSRRS
ncbi:hypothetical protein D3C81_1902830 [compost metagenome]